MLGGDSGNVLSCTSWLHRTRHYWELCDAPQSLASKHPQHGIPKSTLQQPGYVGYIGK